MKYQVDLGQAANLLLVGQNVPYSHRIGAYSAASGATDPGFPVITDDYQFLSSSTIARIGSGPGQSVLAGTGLGLLHAYDGTTGRDAAGFPKVTGGWMFAPAALSDDGRLAGITREGWLYEWKQPDAPACQTEWPAFRHDQQGSGNYDADGTPPAAPERIALAPQGGDVFRLTFRSPGDDVFCGTAERYVATLDGQPLDLGPPVRGGDGFTKDIRIPGGTGHGRRAGAGRRRQPRPARVGDRDGRRRTGERRRRERRRRRRRDARPGRARRRAPARAVAARQTAKLAVLRARVDRRARRLERPRDDHRARVGPRARRPTARPGARCGSPRRWTPRTGASASPGASAPRRPGWAQGSSRSTTRATPTRARRSCACARRPRRRG